MNFSLLSKSNIASGKNGIFLFCSLFLMSLTDFYIPAVGLAILPIIGFILFCLMLPRYPCLVTEAKRVEATKMQMLLTALLALFFVSSLWGAFNSGSIYIKGPIGFGMGALVLFAVLQRKSNDEFKSALLKSVTAILSIHLFFWTLQTLYWAATGTVIDYIEPITHTSTRNIYGAGELTLFRFTGLYAEPAIYTYFVFMGLSIRLFGREFKFGFLDLALVVSAFVSLSILGIFFILILLGVYLFTSRNWKAFMVMALILGVSFAFLSLGKTPITDYLINRTFSPTSDSSGKDRFVDGFTEFFNSPESETLFGKGIGNYDRITQAGNGYAYLLQFLGIYGTFTLFAIIAGALIMHRSRMQIPFLILLSLVGAPIATYSYWWFWIGSMVVMMPKKQLNVASSVKSIFESGDTTNAV